jgi:hypothetical protein
MITSGLCPSTMNLDPFQPVEIRSETPLSDCLAGYQHLKDYDIVERACLSGLIKRHSLEVVIQAARTPDQRRSLLDIYPTDVFKETPKGGNFLKGILLEDAMGL